MATVDVNIRKMRSIFPIITLIVLSANIVMAEYHSMITTVLHRLESSCVILIDSLLNERNSELFDQWKLLTTIYLSEPRVFMSFTDLKNLKWPNGQEISLVNDQKNWFQVYDFLLLPRQKKDRTCLLEPNVKWYPKAETLNEIKDLNTLLEFINVKCNTFKTLNGLSAQGLREKYILENLYKVDEVSSVAMSTLFQGVRQDLFCERKCGLFNSNECEKGVNFNTPAEDIENLYKVDEVSSVAMSTLFQGVRQDLFCERKCGLSNSNVCEKGVNFNTPTEDINVDVSDEIHLFNTGSDYVRTRPPIIDMPKCEEVSKEGINWEIFFNDFLSLSKPVIVRNLSAGWDAYNKWTPDYFYNKFGNKSVHVKLTPGGDFEGVEQAKLWEDHKTFEIPTKVRNQLIYPDLLVVRPASVNMKFAKFLDLIASAASQEKREMSAYLEYSSIPDHLPALEDDIEEFHFVKGRLKRKHLNLWLSDGNTLGRLHFDPYDNLLCQLRGKKQVILFEPHQNERLYEAHIPQATLKFNVETKEFKRRGLEDSTSMVMSPVNVQNPDFQRFPLFAEARPLNCTIDEGDVLFMPAFWWHEVYSSPNRNEKRNMAVNFWYEPFLQKEFPCPECRLEINPFYRHLL